MLGWFAGRQVKRDKSYRSLHREPTGDCSRNRKRDACLPAAQRYDRARGPRDLGARRRTCSSCRTIPPSGGSLARFPIYAEAGRVGAPSNPTPFSSTTSSTGGLRDGESIEPVVPTTGALNRTPNQKKSAIGGGDGGCEVGVRVASLADGQLLRFDRRRFLLLSHHAKHDSESVRVRWRPRRSPRRQGQSVFASA